MKTRYDAIVDKLFVIECRAYKARHLLEGQEDELMRNVRIIAKTYEDLWAVINTSDEKGKYWGWWE